MTKGTKKSQPRLTVGRSLLVAWALVLCAGAEGAEVAPPDVRGAIVSFRLDLEALRWVTGEAKLSAAPWAAANAAPRHLFWQAQALYRGTYQLGEEMAGRRSLPLTVGAWRRSQPREAPSGRDIGLEDVRRLVGDAQDRVRALLLLRNISVSANPRTDVNTGDVVNNALAQMVQANRQVSLMLKEPLPPRDLYNRLLLAVDLAGDLSGGLYPPQPPLSEDEPPASVRQSLLECLRLLPTAPAAQGMQLLALDIAAEAPQQGVDMVDNYGLATALISDLAYLVERVGAAYSPMPQGEYQTPRPVLESHVQRLAGVLQEQMLALAKPPAPPPQDAAASSASVAPSVTPPAVAVGNGARSS